MGQQVVYFFILISLCGCRVKQKSVDRQIEKEKIEQVSEVIKQEDNVVSVDEISVDHKETFEINKNQKIEIESKTDTIKVEQEQIGNKTKLTILGASKVTLSNNDNQVLKKEEKVLETLKNTSTNVLTSETTSTQQENSKNNRKTNTKTFSLNTWLSIGAGIGLAFFVIIYLKRRTKL